VLKSAVLLILLPFVLIGCPTSGASVDRCANGIQDGDETGVDCGGSCGLCPGETCEVAEVCASRVCDPATGCVAPTCDDGVQNGTERGIDCGGSCPEPCRPATCFNGVQDFNETGVDCGGPCEPCSDDPCENGELDPGETDVDCGGPACPPCGEGGACERGGDCETGICFDDVCATAAETCTNGEKDHGESDVDCGGPCPPCATGRFCDRPSDCMSESCVFGVCRDPSCDDGIRNQDESDVDCGGASCPGCPDGGVCGGPGDCASGACEGSRCVSCADGTKNQDETGVDCGGSVCGPCPIGQGCAGHGDCESATCIDGTCRAEGTSAGSCARDAECGATFYCDPVWNGQTGSGAAMVGECRAVGEGAPAGADCIWADDCAGIGCYYGYCTQLCEVDADCANGVCAFGEAYADLTGNGSVDAALPYGRCLGFMSPGATCLVSDDCSSEGRCQTYMVPDPAGDARSPYKVAGRCDGRGGWEISAPPGWNCTDHQHCTTGFCAPGGYCATLCETADSCEVMWFEQTGNAQRTACTVGVRWWGGRYGDPASVIFHSYCARTGSSSSQRCGPDGASALCGPDHTCGAFIIDFDPAYPPKAEYHCVNRVGVLELGAACALAQGGADCASGYCFGSGATGYCSEPCVPGQDRCGSAGLTCRSRPVIERAGVYAHRSLDLNFCQP